MSTSPQLSWPLAKGKDWSFHLNTGAVQVRDDPVLEEVRVEILGIIQKPFGTIYAVTSFLCGLQLVEFLASVSFCFQSESCNNIFSFSYP